MSAQTIPGIPNTLTWAPLESVEWGAIEQLRNVSALPWVVGVRSMPDIHFGYGVPIGSVVAMRDAVSPSAVGVDIACLDAETEFLSPDGWVRMDQWDGEQVLTYDVGTDKAVFAQPQRYIVKDCDEFYWFKNSKGLNQMLSADHRVLVYRGHKAKGYTHEVITPIELAERPLDKGYYTFKAAFTSGHDDIEISDEMIRIEVMIQADGRVRQRKNGQSHVEIHLRRNRKIQRAAQLLSDADINFKQNVWADDSTTFVFSISPEYATKSLSRYWKASARQLSIVADEVLNWDGHRGYRSHFSSTNKDSADLIQYAFTATGIRAGVHSVTGHHRGRKDLHVVTPTKNPMVGYSQPTIVPSKDGRMYCFSVDTGFFVARRGNHIFVTGNCGVSAVQTSVPVTNMPDDLSGLREAIERAIPVGRAKHETPLANPAVDSLFREFSGLKAGRGIEKIEDRARAQVGTLGGGNHFLEVCAGDDEHVWLTLHSGSRGIGKELADRHIDRAKTLSHNAGLPDSDLGVFLAGTPEMREYLNDLYWAQRYAFLNRQTMMRTFIGVFERWVGEPVDFSSHINVHHNYVAEEEIDGERLFVTRKGAIRAGKGELGMIPGSMGVGSYIVRGLGSDESYQSASHGAGRRMSRGEAKRSFTLSDLEEQTQGIECRKDSGVLDEAPGAYKDLASVMADQEDLVEIVQHLRPLVCVKG